MSAKQYQIRGKATLRIVSPFFLDHNFIYTGNVTDLLHFKIKINLILHKK